MGVAMGRSVFFLALIGGIFVVLWTIGGGFNIATRTASQLSEVMTKMSECVNRYTAEDAAAARDPNYLASFRDYTAYKVYTESRARRVEATCIDESGYKTFVLQLIDQMDVDKAKKSQITAAVRSANSVADLERIKLMIK